jgi:hypothetical protein
MLRTLGADAGRDVDGPRVHRRALGGLRVCGVSLVTNAGAGYTGVPLSHEEVLAAGAEAGPRLARVIRRFVADLRGMKPVDRDLLAAHLRACMRPSRTTRCSDLEPVSSLLRLSGQQADRGAAPDGCPARRAGRPDPTRTPNSPTTTGGDVIDFKHFFRESSSFS